MPTYHAYIKGINFRGPEVAAFLAELDYPATVTLEREPENPHDPNAIKAHIDDIFIGYIAKEIAEWLADKMDEGISFTTEAGQPEIHGRATWLPVQIKPIESEDGAET